MSGVAPAEIRAEIVVRGQVQGVGFRPFIWREATALGLHGSVQNRSGRVRIEVYGPAHAIDALCERIVQRHPPLARVDEIARTPLAAADGPPPSSFRIETSAGDERTDAHVPVDTAPCSACRAELRARHDRRHRYAFTNCTACGPRYTIIDALPYDRERTSMRSFPLCPACRREYEDPGDRRFHAEPVACPICGPQLSYERDGVTESGDPLDSCVESLRNGEIVAVKGVGGYHLICDARNQLSVVRLRQRKQRPTRPLALLVPEDLGVARGLVHLDAKLEELLRSPRRPIVLARCRADAQLAEAVAPGVGELGLMLPPSPLHALLAEAFGGPLVATSGNRSGEPLVHEVADARADLAGAADAMLHHDRPIVRPIDDALVRPIAGVPRLLRAGRGFAPVERTLPHPVAEATLCVGGHMKGAVALAFDERVVLSPHLGELDNPRAMQHFAHTVDTLCRLYDVQPTRVVHDAHPDYGSTRWARGWLTEDVSRSALEVWHHHAHAASLVGEHPDTVGTWLVFAWDGVGLGPDGTLWGGEALFGRPGAWSRRARFDSLRIVGAGRAGREPWRSAAGMCWGSDHDYPSARGDLSLARKAWERGLGTHETSAAGRLFDGAASLVLGLEEYGHEAQGPMMLEALAREAESSELPAARCAVIPSGESVTIDWRPLVAVLLDATVPAAARALAFHRALAQAIGDVVALVPTAEAIGLSGGVFQNALLTELVHERLDAAGRRVQLHRDVPANDGGIAFGQAIHACTIDSKRD